MEEIQEALRELIRKWEERQKIESNEFFADPHMKRRCCELMGVFLTELKSLLEYTDDV